MENDAHISLGVKIAIAIAKSRGRRITNQTLADACGNGQSYISSYLFGKGKCTLNSLVAIAECLGFTVDQIIALSRQSFWDQTLIDIDEYEQVSLEELQVILQGDEA